MKFCMSTLMVKSMEESLRFYGEILGLPVVRRFDAGPGVEIAFLGDGETKIELVQSAAVTDIDAGKDISWGFGVDSVDDCMAFMKEKGVTIHSGPFSPNPRTRFFYVTDPNGMKIQLIEEK